MASVLSAASGVSTLTAPSVWFQYCQTASSEPRAAAAPRTRPSRPAASSRSRPAPSLKTISRSCPSSSVEGHLDRRARIQGASHATGQRRPHHRGRLPERAVAADELGAVAGHAATRVVHVEEGRAPGELGVVRVLGEHGAAVRVDRGDHVRGGLPAEVTEDPLHVAGGGQAARSAGGVADLQDRPLHGRRRVHVHPQLRRDAVFGVLEHAVAESMPARVRTVASGRQRRRRPEAAALLVAKVEGLPAGIGDRVVVPGRQAELVGVLGPAVRRTALGDDGAEAGVRQHVDPGRRRHRRPARS